MVNEGRVALNFGSADARVVKFWARTLVQSSCNIEVETEVEQEEEELNDFEIEEGLFVFEKVKEKFSEP